MRKSVIRILSVAAFILCALSASILRADIIYSDFGSPSNPFNLDAGEVVTGNSSLEPSFAFTPASNEVLTEVDFVTSIGESDDTNQVTVSISQDSGGHPGTAIASQEFDNAMGILGGETLDPADPPVELSWTPSGIDLTAGVTYWITLSSPAPGDVTWDGNTDSTPQVGYSELQDGSWVSLPEGTLGAIQILGDADSPSVPEPATGMLVGIGLAGTVGLRLRRS